MRTSDHEFLLMLHTSIGADRLISQSGSKILCGMQAIDYYNCNVVTKRFTPADRFTTANSNVIKSVVVSLYTRRSLKHEAHIQ